MDQSNGAIDFRNRVLLYRQFDAARQVELESLTEEYEIMRNKLDTLEADLADEKETRQGWRKRAQQAETTITRNQFVLVLVDGDGYVFKEEYLRDASEAGGAMAAHRLSSEVQEYLREHNMIDPSLEIQVMVNVYANRAGLAKHLFDADMLHHPNELDSFFCSFTQSQPLFQFIDCGYGKERADAKLRDTFRFYAYNAQCRHIFLACCHDNGYVAELEKYRHDPIASSKTILVDSAQMGRGYRNLNFETARLNVFNTNTISIKAKDNVFQTTPKAHILSNLNETTSPTIPEPQLVNTPSTWSTITASTSGTSTTKKILKPSVIKNASPPPELPEISPVISHVTPVVTGAPTASGNNRIPVNRSGQRIDLKMNPPSMTELDAFEDRIANRKLCNKHHLSNTCYTYNCRYDHEPIDAKMKNTLRYKARSIPCSSGTQCRDVDCFYGHQCPWGRDRCSNPKCAFEAKGMHNITDIDVAKYVPAEIY